MSQVEPLSGIIEEISLSNFMCHESFRVNFNSEVNFLIGENGSGKSAIMTAVSLVLGGRATVTSRGSSIRSFIQTGKTHSQIVIHLKNDGAKAFRPDVYGKRIVIARTITATASSYKIRNEKGKVISIRASDLSQILHHFNIQIENPLCMLNQDVSRSFLNTKDSRSKYKFFLKATQLDLIYDAIASMLENFEGVHGILRGQIQKCKVLEENFVKVERQISLLKGYKKLAAEAKTVKNQMLWSRVIQLETEIENFKKLKTNSEQEFNNLDEQLSQCSQDCSVQSKLNTLRAEIDNFHTKINDLDGKKKDLEDKLKQVSNSIYDVSSKIQDQKVILKRFTDDKARSERMQLEKDRIKAEMIQEAQKRAEQLAKAEQKYEDVIALKATTDNDLNHAENSIAAELSKEKNLYAEIQTIKYQIEKAKESLQQLKEDPKNIYLGYDRQTAHVIRAIKQKESMFKTNPIGPVGTFMRIRDKRWAAAIEFILGADAFRTYLVNDTHDRATLSQIFAEIYGDQPRPGIVLCKFQSEQYQLRSKVATIPGKATCVFELLTFRNNNVANFLVDQYHLEKILTFESDMIGTELLSKKENLPKNCIYGFTKEGNTHYPVPRYRTYHAQAQIVARFLQTDTKSRAKQIENQISFLSNEESEKNMKLNEFRSILRNQTDHVNSLKSRFEQLSASEIKLKRDIMKLKVEKDTKTTDSLEHLESSSEMFTNKIKSIEEEIAKKEQEMANLKESSTEFKEAIAVAESDRKDLLNERISVQKEYKKLSESISENKSRMVRLNVKKDAMQRKLIDFEETLKNMCEKCETELAEAEKHCDRLTPEKDYESLRKDDVRLSEEVKIASLALSDQKTITKEYKKLENEFRETIRLINEIKSSTDELSRALEERKTISVTLTRTITRQIQKYFTEILKYRNFQGHLKINHEEQKLDIFIVPETRKEQNQKPVNVTTLSGGERSYCTVAFVISLWNSMVFPFHFLDEFDVFMDPVNRKTITDLLLVFAKSKPHLQFVFLTPQDVSGIEPQPDLSLFRLSRKKN